MASGQSGVKADALSGYGAATNNAQSLFGPLQNSYAQLASGTDGLSQQQMSDALTAGGQSIGGSTSSITGQGALQEARTGNIGSYGAVADAAMRGAGAQLNDNALTVQNQSDAIARQNQKIGLAGESGLYDTNSGNAASYLNIATHAQPSFWTQYLLNAQKDAASAGAAAGG